MAVYIRQDNNTRTSGNLQDTISVAVVNTCLSDSEIFPRFVSKSDFMISHSRKFWRRLVKTTDNLRELALIAQVSGNSDL